MKLGDYMTAVVADLKANATFLKDVGTHGKVFGLEELKMLVLTAPACRVALMGARGGSAQSSIRGQRRDMMGRADNGQFRGPLQMMAFLIEQDDPESEEEARDRVIRLADDFMFFLEERTFGLKTTQAGPAQVTGFEILYSAEIDNQGAAIAAVSWEQEVFFGRDIHAEDMALLTGDEFAQYPPGQRWYSEGEWATKGKLDKDVPPLVRGVATPEHSGEDVPDTADHEPIDIPGEED